MIIVTGATGKLGQAVTERLLELVPADQVGVSVRDPAKAQALMEQGVRVREGNFADPESLRHAFEGASQVLIISVNGVGEGAVRQHRNAIEAAQAAGARRVLYTSHMGARGDSPFAPASDHAATEAFLAEGGVPFTSLRHGFYAESALYLIGDGLQAGEIRAPEDGPVSWTATADLAAADAHLLAEEGRLGGLTPPLTAPEALTLADLAALASELTGRGIKRVTISDDEWRDARVAQGVPAPVAEMLLGMFRAARRGDFAATDPALENLLGRPAVSMRDFLGSRLAASAQ